MLPSPRRRGLGLRNHFLSRPPLGSLALRPGDSLTIPKMALSVGFIRFVSSTDATRATGLLTLALVGLTPTEHVRLVWTHCVSNWEFSRRIRDSATLLVARRLTYADPHMRNLLLALLHLAVVTAKLCGSGGVRAVMAENLLLKQQLIVLRRARKRAPNLTPSDRLLCGFWSIFLSPGRIRKAAIALQPSTLLAFHQALVRCKYRRLFLATPRPKKPGPNGLLRPIWEAEREHEHG